MRVPVLIAALLFIGMLAALTIVDVINYGVSPLSVVSVMILALFAIGIVGALRHPPEE